MDENIDVAPSDDNGNVPLETPSEQETVTSTETEAGTTTEPELYELPDGRQVDAETLSREWKENFMPDYTRKSQELAAVKAPITNNERESSPYADPNYVPKSYQELIEVAKQAALADMEGREQAREEARQNIEQEVATQLANLKRSDPTLDENALFLHANKYQFSDLNLAHENMRAMAVLAKNVQRTTARNVAKRNDPVSVVPGPTGARPNPAHFATAADYLRSLK